MPPLLDLTHLFTASMPVFPGDEPPVLKQSSQCEQTGYNDYRLTTGMHVGTHLDGPLHMIAGGKKLCEFPPEKFFGRGVLVDAREALSLRGAKRRSNLCLEASLLKPYNIQKNDIVLVMTGFSKYYREHQKKYFNESPVFSLEFAQTLVDKGVSIVGMDMSSPDKSPYEVHKLLLRHDVLVLENLTNLEKLIGVKNFDVIALPAKLDADSAPTRVVALIGK